MEITLYSQTITFLWSFAMGAALTVIYIITDTARELSPPGKFMIFAEDMLFTFIVSTANLLFAIARTQGYIRWYVVTAQLISFIAIYFTVGRLLKRILKAVMKLVKFCKRKILGAFRDMSAKFSQKMLQTVKKIKNPPKIP